MSLNARPADSDSSFDAQFVALFESRFPGLFRYLDRLSGDAALASDLAQEAFVRLYRRGALPNDPEKWLVTVAMNLFRNARGSHGRRSRLLTVFRGLRVHSDPPPSPADASAAEDSRRIVRRVVDRLPERDRQLLLLSAEGYSYRDLAATLDLNESSVGTLLARARKAFREAYAEETHAS
jgi:RNA polymerase sigma factor (sigma-70 family)